MDLFLTKTYYFYIGNIQVKDSIRLLSFDLDTIYDSYHEVAFVNEENKEMRLDNLTLAESVVLEKENLSNENISNFSSYLLDFIPNIPQAMELGTFKVMKRFHHSFYNAMYKYLISKTFIGVLKEVAKERMLGNVFPEMENQLNVYSMPISKIKVVIVGLDPYPSVDASGYCFGTNRKVKPLSLEKLNRGILDNLGLDSKEYYLRNDLSHLIKQGVFLLNTSLTIRKGQPKGHLPLWKDLITFTLESLNKVRNRQIIFIFLGADAQKNARLITKHIVLTTEHPAKSGYEKREFLHSNIFSNTNRYLQEQKKKEIVWIEKIVSHG